MPLAQIEPSNPLLVTRHDVGPEPNASQASVARRDGGKTLPAVTRHKKIKLPKDHGLERPPKIEGFHWRKKGAGWELRRDVYIEENGARKRKQPYVAHLSRTAFEELKRVGKGANLRAAIERWIVDHD
jgi:hypothetical protein